MRYFVYAMNGKAPVPAAGGDTESWFFLYKWDTGGDAFVPVPASLEKSLPVAGDLLWFVLDQVPIGFVPVTKIEQVDSGDYEVHYDTQKIIGPGKVVSSFLFPEPTGIVKPAMVDALQRLQRHYSVTYPPRGSSAPPPVPPARPKPPTGTPVKQDSVKDFPKPIRPAGVRKPETTKS